MLIVIRDSAIYNIILSAIIFVGSSVIGLDNSVLNDIKISVYSVSRIISIFIVIPDIFFFNRQDSENTLERAFHRSRR